MRNIKFKRYQVGEEFNPEVAERDTVHLVPVGEDPLTIEAYDVDAYGNVAKIVDGTTATAIANLLKPATEASYGLVKKAATQADSAAVSVEELLVDFNALLAKLKAAGLMS